MEIIFKISEIDSTARQFLTYGSGHKIFTFSGDLGAGKTTFIDALCKALGVQEPVTSPTYSLIHEYRTDNGETIYHMDFYRLNSLAEAIDAGIEECLASGEYCMIEWPSKVKNILIDDCVKSDITVLGENIRKLVVQLP